MHPDFAKSGKLISWHPDPGAMAFDAFSVSWSNMSCYAFPPFSLLPRVLAKVLNDKALVLLISPVWPTYTELVSTSATIVNRSTYQVTSPGQSSIPPTQSGTTSLEEQARFGRLEVI